MKNGVQYVLIFMIGAIGYGILEIAFRGYTHWTMFLTGGVCFCILYVINKLMMKKALWKKCFVGATLITGIEFVVGCIVNIWFKWNVWDYSALKFQIFGQVCVLFSILWFILCIPVFLLSSKIEKKWS